MFHPIALDKIVSWTLTLDLGAEAEAAGFVDVAMRGLSPANFPYVLLAKKSV